LPICFATNASLIHSGLYFQYKFVKKREER
jgi:hypothetical protein